MQKNKLEDLTVNFINEPRMDQCLVLAIILRLREREIVNIVDLATVMLVSVG